MPTYEYRCPHGHYTTTQKSMHDEIPAERTCHALLPGEALLARAPDMDGCYWNPGDPSILPDPDAVHCGEIAWRIFSPPAALHFKGAGFYATDVKSRFERKRRPNPGDDLPLPSEAAVSRSEGAEKDNDPSGFTPDGMIKRVRP